LNYLSLILHAEHSGNARGNVSRGGQNVHIPETDHSVTELLDVLGSLGIEGFSLIVAVSIAVNLDHEFRSKADEICDVPTQRVLSAELESSHPFCSKDRPHSLFGLVLVLAQVAGSFGEDRVSSHNSDDPSSTVQRQRDLHEKVVAALSPSP
jgi:hypothetical protein